MGHPLAFRLCRSSPGRTIARSPETGLSSVPTWLEPTEVATSRAGLVRIIVHVHTTTSLFAFLDGTVTCLYTDALYRRSGPSLTASLPFHMEARNCAHASACNPNYLPTVPQIDWFLVGHARRLAAAGEAAASCNKGMGNWEWLHLSRLWKVASRRPTSQSAKVTRQSWRGGETQRATRRGLEQSTIQYDHMEVVRCGWHSECGPVTPPPTGDRQSAGDVHVQYIIRTYVVTYIHA